MKIELQTAIAHRAGFLESLLLSLATLRLPYRIRFMITLAIVVFAVEAAPDRGTGRTWVGTGPGLYGFTLFILRYARRAKPIKKVRSSRAVPLNCQPASRLSRLSPSATSLALVARIPRSAWDRLHSVGRALAAQSTAFSPSTATSPTGTRIEGRTRHAVAATASARRIGHRAAQSTAGLAA